MFPHARRWAVCGILLAASACGKQEASSTLPTLSIDPARVTVSGISAGAYMAQQVEFALGERISGAALLAGGPYGCAGGDLDTALKQCMSPPESGPDVAALAATIRARADAGAIAPLSTLEDDRVYVFHGTHDAVVSESVSRASASIYAAVGATVELVEDFTRETAHVFPTMESGADCATGGAPYLGKCNYDAAGALFAALYNTDSGARPAAPTGRVLTYDQSAYVKGAGDPELAETGYAYIPAKCEHDTCGLHIAFHGCEQSSVTLGTMFVEQAGYNRWADVAGVVVVYPQVQSSMMPLNPKGCWDWWGYTGADYDTREGAQIRHVAALIDALTRH